MHIFYTCVDERLILTKPILSLEAIHIFCSLILKAMAHNIDRKHSMTHFDSS